MPITPDTKDWTWVLHRPCPECGFDTSAFPRESLPDLILGNAKSWHNVLASTPSAVTRPAPEKWSALEYGCHVRDVLRLYDQRLELMLSQDDPLFANWDQDATAVAERYGEQDRFVVAAELSDAARSISARFGAVTGEQWQREGRRSDGAQFTIESFARYFLHDLVHHLHDVAG